MLLYFYIPELLGGRGIGSLFSLSHTHKHKKEKKHPLNKDIKQSQDWEAHNK